MFTELLTQHPRSLNTNFNFISTNLVILPIDDWFHQIYSKKNHENNNFTFFSCKFSQFNWWLIAKELPLIFCIFGHNSSETLYIRTLCIFGHFAQSDRNCRTLCIFGQICFGKLWILTFFFLNLWIYNFFVKIS